MTIPIRHYTWQVLRTLARAAPAAGPLPGKALRPAPLRGTADGLYLLALVDAGLLEIVRVKPEGTPFEHSYILTPLGRHAAEYGEFEGEPALVNTV